MEALISDSQSLNVSSGMPNIKSIEIFSKPREEKTSREVDWVLDRMIHYGSIEYAKKIWTDLGFKEMTGTITDTSFWNFDALFTAQDHPVRELHDTFFIKDVRGTIPDKKILENVKKTHERGISGSKGWQYSWKEEEAKKPVLRTHTTILSAHTLSKLKDEDIYYIAETVNKFRP